MTHAEVMQVRAAFIAVLLGLTLIALGPIPQTPVQGALAFILAAACTARHYPKDIRR